MGASLGMHANAAATLPEKRKRDCRIEREFVKLFKRRREQRRVAGVFTDDGGKWKRGNRDEDDLNEL